MKKNLLISVALVGTVFSGLAAAQGYVGGSLGRSYLNPTESDWTNARFDKNDNSWKFFGGYNFSQSLGVEVAYADLGRYQATIAGVGAASVKVSTWDLFLTGRLPLGTSFGLTGKLGAAYNRASMSFTSFGAGLPDSGTNNRTSVAWGVGLTYSITKNLALRGEYEDFGKAGNSNGGFAIRGNTSDSHPNLWSAGLQYSF